MLLLLTVLFQTFTEFGAFKHTTLRRFNGFVLDGSKDHQAPYFDALNEVMHDIKDRYFFPGHRGGEFAPSNMIRRYGKPIFDLDLPELDGLDNIHSPEGPLLDALELASRLFESYRTWFLVNGSTSGILAAILACARLHDRSRAKAGSNAVVIMGRDSHKSAFDALSIAGCDAALLPCTWDDNFGVTVGVEIESIEQALDEHGSNVCAVLLTRPTYQGILCSTQRLRDISALCHARGVPLIVDEAHGSHLRFLRGSGDFYPHARDALDCGADVVVQSAHKTLTALSQCAFLHIGKNAFSFPSSCISDVDVQNSVPELSQTEAAAEVLHECFSMLTTTSPNALLLASLDATRAQMAHSGYSMVSGTAAAVDELRNKLRRGGGGVQLLDDSQSFLKSKTIQRHGHGSSSTRVEEDENKANSRVWYVDPLRLTVRFPGRSALRVDDTMCEGELGMIG